MNKRHKPWFMTWQLWCGLGLLSLSATLFLCHFLFFHDVRGLFFYLVHNLAYLPIEVLLVTLILHQMLNRREKKIMLGKLNMIIGTFYSEVGYGLIRRLVCFDRTANRMCSCLAVKPDWTDARFSKAVHDAEMHEFAADSRTGDLAELRAYLIHKRSFLLILLENPNLLEHETFTDLLWSVFHLTEELEFRPDLKALPDTDLNHLSGDMKRAYHLLTVQWLLYMKHLMHSYPYLFSLAVRTNPFDNNASVQVQS